MLLFQDMRGMYIYMYCFDFLYLWALRKKSTRQPVVCCTFGSPKPIKFVHKKHCSGKRYPRKLTNMTVQNQAFEWCISYWTWGLSSHSDSLVFEGVVFESMFRFVTKKPSSTRWKRNFPFGPEISPKIPTLRIVPPHSGISLLVTLAERDVMRPKRSQQKGVDMSWVLAKPWQLDMCKEKFNVIKYVQYIIRTYNLVPYSTGYTWGCKPC